MLSSERHFLVPTGRFPARALWCLARPARSAVKLSDIKSGTLNLIDLNLNGLLDDPSGFAISGLTSDALLGHSVSDAGDVNGDGFDDLILGAYGLIPTVRLPAQALWYLAR